MGACSFFGHRTAGSFLIPDIKNAIIDMISRGVNLFYVGNNGAFADLLQQFFIVTRAVNDSVHDDFLFILKHLEKEDIIIDQSFSISFSF